MLTHTGKQHSLFIIFLLINALVLPVHGKEITKVTLDLFWQHQFEFAGFYAAVDQGYFQQAGIEVEFNELDSQDDYLQRVLNGEAHFGVAGAELLASYHNGNQVKLLASYFRRSPLILLTQPEITSLKQLEGKVVIGAKKTWLSLIWYLLIVALLIISVVIFWNRKIANYAQKIAKAHKELKETQQQLVQSEKMASLGTLSSGVAHEINNPTSFTYTSVYLMKDEIKEIKSFLTELAGGDNADPKVLQAFDDKFAKLTKLAETATEGTKRIKTIVNNLRTFTRLDSEEHIRSTLNDLITSTVNLVRTQYDNIDISTQFHADPQVNCSPSKLAQVFMNLTVNACQAIESQQQQQANLHGAVKITTRQEQQKLLICFNDNGCGMDEKTQSRIFEPFFTTKDVGSGTGLGMSISFGIVQEHRGHFDINSTPGQGTSITLSLPLS